MRASAIRSNRTVGALLAAALILFVLALPTFAVAQDASVSGYAGGGGGNQGTLGQGNAGGPTTSAQSSQSGTLPFTGLDIGMMAAGGLILIAAGAGIGRVVSRQPSA